jgi:hypothetical protein
MREILAGADWGLGGWPVGVSLPEAGGWAKTRADWKQKIVLRPSGEMANREAARFRPGKRVLIPSMVQIAITEVVHGGFRGRKQLKVEG